MPTLSEIIKKLLNEGSSRNDRQITDFEQQLINQYSQAADDINIELGKLYEKLGDNVNYSEVAKYNRLKNLEAQISQRIGNLFGITEKQMKEKFKSTFEFSYYFSGYAAESALDAKLGFGTLNDDIIEKSLTNPLDRVKWQGRLKGHHEKAAQQIVEEITQGFIQQKGYGKTAQMIRGRVDQLDNNARRIVWTESHRIQQEARLKSFEHVENLADKLDYKTDRIWDATLDERTRNSHRIMDGQKAGKDGMFDLKGIKIKGPGMTGIPEEDIHCRCNVRIQIEGFEPKYRRDNVSKETIPYKTFDEWFENRVSKKS